MKKKRLKKVSNTITYLENNNLMKDYCKVLDWLLDDNKFSKDNWAKGKTIKYTDWIKNII